MKSCTLRLGMWEYWELTPIYRNILLKKRNISIYTGKKFPPHSHLIPTPFKKVEKFPPGWEYYMEKKFKKNQGMPVYMAVVYAKKFKYSHIPTFPPVMWGLYDFF
jgi:hypothetical protein